MDWSHLPEGLMEEVVKKLGHMELLNFGAVCTPWRVFYLANRHLFPKDLPMSLLPQAPFLLNSCKPKSDSRKYHCVVNKDVQGELFIPRNKWISGCSLGWLIIVDIKGEDISLFNPFTKHEINLPSLTTSPQDLNFSQHTTFHYMVKAIISTDPISRPQDCVVMVIGLDRRLTFCKLGDVEWTKVEGSMEQVEDVVFHRGWFYVLTRLGLTISYDGENPNDHNKAEVVAHWTSNLKVPKRYLVPSGDDLLHVWKIYRSYNRDNDYNNKLKPNQSVSFEILKLVERKSAQLIPPEYVEENFRGCTVIKFKWSKALESLQDRLIFIGYSSSSVPSSTHENRIGTRIYFSDDFLQDHIMNLRGSVNHPVQLCHDIGYCDMENGESMITTRMTRMISCRLFGSCRSRGSHYICITLAGAILILC